jgi:hypothetical protein
VRTIIIAVAAAALAASSVVAQGASVAQGHPHKITAKHHSGLAAHASMRAGGIRTSNPGAPAYAPDQFRRLDRDVEASRQAGGGGGGGGGGGM